MPKKYIIILVLAAALVVLGVSAYLSLRAPVVVPQGGNAESGTAENEVLSPAASAPEWQPDPETAAGFPKGETIAIGTPSGSVVVKNFYPRIVGGEEESVVILKTPSYFVSYDTFDSSFWIALTAKPFSEARVLAEKDFLAMLGIGQDDACRLEVKVGVPYRADPSQAGKSTGLSFCPGRL